MNSKDKIINKISGFPVLPTMTSRLMGLLNDPNASVAEITKVIQYDPALTANLLKAANSAYLGLSKKVDSLSEAFFRLGTKWVYQMSISSLIKSNMNRPVSGYDLSGKDLWRHSVAVAQMSDILCQLLDIKESSVVFTAGLLHDMGKIIMGEFVSNSFEKIGRLVSEQGIPFEEAEKQVVGIDHAEVGSITAEKWNFPPAIVDCIRWHHQPEQAESQTITIDIVHVADATCIMNGLGIGKDDIHYRLNNSSIERLNLTGKILEKATSQLLISLEEIENIISNKSASKAVGRL